MSYDITIVCVLAFNAIAAWSCFSTSLHGGEEREEAALTRVEADDARRAMNAAQCATVQADEDLTDDLPWLGDLNATDLHDLHCRQRASALATFKAAADARQCWRWRPSTIVKARDIDGEDK